MNATAWLGVDLGGTNCRLALVDDSREIKAQRTQPTNADQGPDAVIARLAEAVRDMISQAGDQGLKAAGVGVACAGVIDARMGRVVFAPNLRGWRDVDLAARLTKAVDLPVAVCNDADAYALGEQAMGAGQGSDHQMCFTLGTGVGGGLIVNGSLVSGPLGTGGEVGHLIVEPQGRKCGCGARGCVEAYASATGLSAMLGQALDDGRQSVLTVDADPKSMATAAREGDALAKELFVAAGDALGRAMAAVAVLTGVDLMIIGGGLAKAWDLMEPGARAFLNENLYIAEPTRVRIALAELGDMAAALGAAGLARGRN